MLQPLVRLVGPRADPGHPLLGPTRPLERHQGHHGPVGALADQSEPAAAAPPQGRLPHPHPQHQDARSDGSSCASGAATPAAADRGAGPAQRPQGRDPACGWPAAARMPRASWSVAPAYAPDLNPRRAVVEPRQARRTTANLAPADREDLRAVRPLHDRPALPAQPPRLRLRSRRAPVGVRYAYICAEINRMNPAGGQGGCAYESEEPVQSAGGRSLAGRCDPRRGSVRSAAAGENHLGPAARPVIRARPSPFSGDLMAVGTFLRRSGWTRCRRRLPVRPRGRGVDAQKKLLTCWAARENRRELLRVGGGPQGAVARGGSSGAGRQHRRFAFVFRRKRASGSRRGDSRRPPAGGPTLADRSRARLRTLPMQPRHRRARLFSGKGATYLYQRRGRPGHSKAALAALDEICEDRFGTSVDVEGGVAVVGAHFNRIGDEFRGRHTYSATAGMDGPKNKKLTTPDGFDWQEFGGSVSWRCRSC